MSVWRKHPGKGWKNDFVNKNLKQNCKITKNVSNLISCIDKNTFTLSEVLETKPIEIGDESSSRFTNASLWSEDLSNFDLGKVFTLNNSYRIGHNSDHLQIYFKKGNNYTISIHDPHYYMYALNPFTIPQIRLVITDSKSRALYIEVILPCFLGQTRESLRVLKILQLHLVYQKQPQDWVQIALG